jgi:hypothetical protein
MRRSFPAGVHRADASRTCHPGRYAALTSPDPIHNFGSYLAGQQDPTQLVSATLTRVQPLECEEADPGVPSSICIRVEARLADGKQVRFETTDLTGTTFRAGQQVTLSV